MDKKEINAGNKLIVDFMGIKPTKSGDDYSYRDGVFFHSNSMSEEKVMQSIVEYVKYYTSWDWLMPVVEKIEREGFKTAIENKYCSIDGNGEDTDGIWFEESSDTKISATFLTVIKAIEWYNANIKSEAHDTTRN